MNGARKAFTLLELMVAVMIFSLVVGTVYFTLRAGIESFHKGHESMEAYQSVRIGLSRMGRDVRQAVSPESPWSNVAEHERRYGMDPVADWARSTTEDYREDPRDKNDIIFVGDSRQMTFVVSELIPGADPPFDLREIRFFVDTQNKLLMRETTRSIMQQRFLDWRALRSDNETDFRLSFSSSAEIDKVMVEIAKDIKDMELRYYDGAEWRDSWDSNQYVEEEFTYETSSTRSFFRSDEPALPDEEPRRLGLPDAVRISLHMLNNDVVQLITELPAKDADRLANETEFVSGRTGLR